MMPQNVNLREQYAALDAKSQENVTNFFNCHNVAISIYNQLPQDAKDYVDTCIYMVNHSSAEEHEVTIEDKV